MAYSFHHNLIGRSDSFGLGSVPLPAFLRSESCIETITLKRESRFLGNRISLYDASGHIVVDDDIKSIARIFNSHQSIGNKGDYVDYFHILFTSGNLLTFNQYLENNFTLEKLLKSRMQQDFDRISWDEYQAMEQETPPVRVERILNAPANPLL